MFVIADPKYALLRGGNRASSDCRVLSTFAHPLIVDSMYLSSAVWRSEGNVALPTPILFFFFLSLCSRRPLELQAHKNTLTLLKRC